MNIVALKGYFDQYQANVTEQEVLKKQIADLQDKLSGQVAQADGFKKLMLNEVKSSGEKTVKLGSVALTVTPGKDSLKIDDESKIPAKYTTTKIVLNNAAIKAALLNGGEVPGARIVTGDDYLTIK